MKGRINWGVWLAALLWQGCADRVAPGDAALDHGSPTCLADAPAAPRMGYCEESPSTVGGECWDWARSHTFEDQARARCVYDDRSAYCIQVTTGPDYTHPDAAWACGDEPPCSPGFVCVAASSSGPFHCECINR